MAHDEYTACFSTEPAFPKPFPSTPKHLHEFFYFLEQEGIVGTAIECYTIKRSSQKVSASGAGRYSKYDVSPTEECGFRTKPNKTLSLFQGVRPQAVSDSKYVRFMMRLKFVKDQKCGQPQRPALHHKKGVIFKLAVVPHEAYTCIPPHSMYTNANLLRAASCVVTNLL